MSRPYKPCRHCGAVKENQRKGKKLCDACAATWPQYRSEYMKRHKKENAEKVRLRNRDYEARNPGKAKAWKARYKADKISATPIWLSDEDWNDIVGWYDLAAIYDQQVDHIVPLRGENVCGLHVPWNLQLLPFTQNQEKGNKLKEDMIYD